MKPRSLRTRLAVFKVAAFIVLALLFAWQAHGAVTAPTSRRRYVAKAVDLTATGTTVLVPIQPCKWITTSVRAHVKSSTALTIVGSASIGTNSASFNNLMAITVVGVNTAVVDTTIDLTSSLLTAALDLTSTALTLKVTTGATATAETADIHVEGFCAEP
jgi:HAMP domain-containing protein